MQAGSMNASFHAPLRAAAKRSSSRAPIGRLQRKCACGGTAGPTGECEECRKKRLSLQHKIQRPGIGTTEQSPLPPIVRDVLRSNGQPLDVQTRKFMESRFGHNFSSVRVHTDAKAAESARMVNAQAYTVGRDVVFAAGRYGPRTAEGRSLLAHELTHVVQQHTARLPSEGQPGDTLEQQADALAARVAEGYSSTTSRVYANGRSLQRKANAESPESTVTYDYELGSGFGVCARDTKIVPGVSAMHAFIDAAPFRYGLLKRCGPAATSGPGLPLISGANLGLPLNPTAAMKTDRSPDPCGRKADCVPCKPRPGVRDLATCFRQAYSAYPVKSEYIVFPGPNSNTFAGTLARACCEGMESAPASWKAVPGWGHSPASPVEATCPSGPSTCEDPDRPDPIGRGLRGLVAGGLLGAAGGAGIGALLSLIPGVGAIAGTAALIGAGIFGLAGLFAGLK
jgi:hypothetical protein